MSSLLSTEFVQALNPLYAFPIVAVILCAFIVYAFGFKSPVQPPSFEGIEEEKKIPKKRKAKEASKAKVIQNGKVNGNISNKAQVVVSNKKKEVEKPVSTEKVTSEKKVTKKGKSHNEKKASQEKKESFSQEDAGEDGWVQLISKKGRKSRKKDEASLTENQVIIKPVKISPVQSNEEPPVKGSVENEIPKTDVEKEISKNTKEHEIPKTGVENPVPKTSVENSVLKTSEENAVQRSSVESAVSKTKPVSREGKKKDTEAVAESNKDSISVIENAKLDADNSEKEKVKLPEESSSKSKKKKKKTSDIPSVNKDVAVVSSTESPAVQVVPELPSQDAGIISPEVTETPEVISGKVQENQPKESKSSNVVFDELAGLYPEPKEQRKKKRVRRDH